MLQVPEFKHSVGRQPEQPALSLPKGRRRLTKVKLINIIFDSRTCHASASLSMTPFFGGFVGNF